MALVTQCFSLLASVSMIVGVVNARAQSDAGSADSYLRRGDAWYEKGQWDRAIAEYDRAIALGSARAEPYNNRGNARQAIGDLEGAYQDYSRALEINPRLAPTYNNRGIIRQIRGDLNGAIADYTEAIATRPELRAGLHQPGYGQASQGRPRGGPRGLEPGRFKIQGFKVQVQSWPTRSASTRATWIWLSLTTSAGALFLAKDDFAKALADFDRAIEINRRFPEAYYQPRHRPAAPWET